jgi:hypothetical protein
MTYPIVVGIDPDSNSHGMAVFQGGQLCELINANLVTVAEWLDKQPDLAAVLFSIEDVKAQSFVYTRNAHANKQAHANIALRVGRCQQAQIELERVLDSRGVAFELHKPSGSNWYKNTDRFKRTTGWAGRSNDETRSAAFFGWLAVQGQSRER